MTIDILWLAPIGEGAGFGFVHSQLFAVQNNIKGAGGSTSLASWLRPEWMVTSVTHLGVVYFIQVHMWLRFVRGYLWLDPTGICRHDWMQVVGWNPVAPVGTEDCNSLAVCLGWNLFVSLAPNDGYPWSESRCVPGEDRLRRLPCLPFCPGSLPEEEGVVSVAVSNSEGIEEMVAEARAFDNVISWNSLKFFSCWSLDTASQVSTGIISRRHSGRILWGPSFSHARLTFLFYSSAISSSRCTHAGQLSFFCSTRVWCDWPSVIVKKEAVVIPGLLPYISYHHAFLVFCDKVNKLEAKKRVLMWITLSSNNIGSLDFEHDIEKIRKKWLLPRVISKIRIGA